MDLFFSKFVDINYYTTKKMLIGEGFYFNLRGFHPLQINL